MKEASRLHVHGYQRIGSCIGGCDTRTELGAQKYPCKSSQDALLVGGKGLFSRDPLIRYWMNLVASVKSTEQNGKIANFILEV